MYIPFYLPNKKKKAEGAKRNYLYKKSLSEKRIRKILEDSGFEIKLEINYTPKYNMDDIQ